MSSLAGLDKREARSSDAPTVYEAVTLTVQSADSTSRLLKEWKGAVLYIIVDMEGASRAYLHSLGDLHEWLEKMEETYPEVCEEIIVFAYDGPGGRIGDTRWADEVLEELREFHGERRRG
jgi:hypothetical protein